MAKKKVKHKKKKILLGMVLFIIISLVAARIYLPYWLKDYVNNVLDNIEGYKGSVEDIDVHLYRGAYTIKKLRLDKTNAKVPVPFLYIDDTDLSIQWRALIHGRIVSEVYLTNATINFVSRGGKAVQTGKNADWTKAIKDLAPIDINFVKVNGGKISYHDYSASPDIDLYINNLNGELSNLRNVEHENNPLPSDIKVSGSSIGGGKFNLKGKINALRQTPDMDMDIKLENANLTAINDFTNEYAGIDFVKGNLSIYSEFIVKNGHLTGYVKPLATGIQVVSLKQDKNIFELVWESIASIIIEIFENQSKDQFATRIPLEGNIDKKIETSTWDSVIAIFQNAFIEAFKRGTDGNISFFSPKKAEEKPK